MEPPAREVIDPDGLRRRVRYLQWMAVRLALRRHRGHATRCDVRMSELVQPMLERYFAPLSSPR